MNLCLIGIDYRKASVDIREEVYRRRKQIAEFCAQRFSHAEILATCNRFEVYGITADTEEGLSEINSFLCRFPEFLKYGYTKSGKKQVSRHLLSLASGLESQIKGERQILEQLNVWRCRGSFPDPLAGLVEEAVLLANEIRIESGLSGETANIAELVMEDLRTRVCAKPSIIVIGTGKVAQLFADVDINGGQISFASRKNYLVARELARRKNGEAMSFESLPHALLSADGLIGATKSPHFVLREKDLRKVAAKRHRPLYIYDLALPRSIDPVSARLDNIVLRNLDDLTLVFQEHSNRIKNRLNLAEYLTAEKTDEYRGVFYAENPEGRHAAKPAGLKTG